MLNFILFYPKYCKPKYFKQFQYLLTGKVLKKFLNIMKIESILQIQKTIQSKKKITYSFSSAIFKIRNNPPTLTEKVFRELITAETSLVSHSSSANIKTSSMCSQHLANTQLWQKQQVPVPQDVMPLHFSCTLEL